MMGKSMVGNSNTTPPEPGSGPCCSVDTPCDEEALYGVYDNYIQLWYPYYATENENVQNPILCPRRDAQLIISPKQTHLGFYDGFSNDNLKVFAVKLRFTEIWSYLNGDNEPSHPLHFHLTSGYAYQAINPTVDPIYLSKKTYSRDIYQLGPQTALSFAITWPYYSSADTTSTPYIPNIGSVIHCHILPHYDENSMAIIYAVRPASNFISNICFPAGTPITTDQGNIPIETILPNIHTINNKKIVDITKTITLEDYLVCFEEGSVSTNIPSQKTIISPKHKLYYNGKMMSAELFIGKFNNVYKVEYDGEILYNVLMENYDIMLVNNLICETLHPDNILAKLHTSCKNVNTNEYEQLIENFNQYNIRSTTNI